MNKLAREYEHLFATTRSPMARLSLAFLGVLSVWLLGGALGCGDDAQPGRDAAIPCQEPTDCPVGFECLPTDGGMFCQPRPDAGPPPDSTVGIPALTVSATELDFGAPLLGIPVSQELTLGNAGTGDLHVTSLLILEDDLADELFLDAPSERPLVIAPGESLTIAVTLHAVDAEEDQGYLLIGSNDAERAAVLVKLVSANKGTPVLGVCVNEEADPPAPLTACVDPTAFDYELMPYGSSAVRIARLRNTNPGNAVLTVDSVEVPVPPAVPAPLFGYDIFTLVEDPQSPGAWIEEPATLPYLLAPQQASPDLYLRVTFTADVDRYLESMMVSVHTLGASDLVTEVPILWQVSGCPEGYLDLSPGIPGCEYACPVYPALPEGCNAVDDDCDGQVDEDFDLTTDSANCGFCGHQCLLGHASSDCQNSLCVITACETSLVTGWANVNGDPSDGCEYPCPVWPAVTESCNDLDDDCDGLADEDFNKITDPQNCGSCGNDCVAQGKVCIDGSCELTCPLGTTDCGGTCVNLSNDPAHCGECDRVCSFPDAQASCISSTCMMGPCLAGHRDLDGLETTGCEYACPVWPTATEVCNGLDDDCDGQTDEGVKTTFYRDSDSDGHGDPMQTTQACAPPAGYVATGTDCDDQASGVYPGAPELCDTVDNNCNGVVDEGVQAVFYRDQDTDGYGDVTQSVQACSAPAGHVAQGGDCNDAANAINPGATEICDGVDNNCNGVVDEGVQSVFYRDADGDGYGDAAQTTFACSAPAGYVANATDCNDSAIGVHPGATELCDAVDNNCNGLVDEGVLQTYYQDQDGDGYGNVTVSVQACSQPAGYVANGTDCNDGANAVNPGATEVCDTVDNNCNGVVDEGEQSVFYRDADGDSYGNAAQTTFACSAPAGYVANGTDCNDAANGIHPGATELCDTVDNNCNGLVDEGMLQTYYRDADGDGYGNLAVTVQACAQPAGYAANGTDCNDGANAIHPGATEVCDGQDNDCDGAVDEGVQAVFYRDADGDGYGDAAQTTFACSAPAGYVANGTDCNDGANAIHPGATEVCDSVDNNCNGLVDEGVLVAFYRDQDSDGYGDVTQSVQACSQPAGYVPNSADCNDAANAIHPGATELCDGFDNNCNGVVDEGVQSIFFRDADGDSYGNAALTTFACSAPAGYVANATDCNDGANAIHPGAAEVCDTVDNNCNGLVDEGVLQTFYRDSDSDLFGNPGVTVQACSQPAGYVTQGGDCNDGAGAINPGAAEVCDAVDNNCNGLIDELFDKQNDPLNCGSCGTDCTTMFPNASGICVSGACQIGFCDSGWRDDPSAPGDDCAYHCPVWPTVTETCNGLDDDCDAQVDESFDLVNDPNHCGGCNNKCSDLYPNAQVECVSSSCRMVGCNSSYYDLDAGAPGCEYHCPTNPPQVEVCNLVDDDCDGLTDEGFDLQNDPLNCGACGQAVGPDEICCAGVPTPSDESNCGYCGRSCQGSVQCFGGSCIEPGIIVITELQINPEAVDDTQGEWVEIFNTTGYDINLFGWIMDDDGADNHVISDNVIVPPLDYVILGRNANFGSNGGIVVDYQYAGFVLGNDGDEVVILANGVEVDRVDYTAAFDVLRRSKELSRNHIDDGLNDTLTNWCTAVNQLPSTDYGTPGRQNDCAL